MTARGEHWLWRLDAPAWFAAARAELERGRAHLDQRRTVVAHARRAAGMACNAVLVGCRAVPEEAETMWGRSYVEHLRAIADGRTSPLPPSARALAERLLAVPLVAPALVALSGQRAADLVSLLDDTAAFLQLCHESVSFEPM